MSSRSALITPADPSDPRWARLERRADRYQGRDPFPLVSEGLLSSAEIRDYIYVTGLVDTFNEDALKSASYEVFVGGTFVRWKGKKKLSIEIDRTKSKSVTFPANSISFIQVENTFRLPNYIAMRFNLQIAQVHRGLLLGTGPLVDPGFRGKLLIPIHNLTSSAHEFDLSKALIWVEFTKTTATPEPLSLRHTARLARKVPKHGQFKPFRPEKRGLTAEDYLFKANGGRPIVSSIPDALLKSRKDAKSAKRSADTLQKWARGIGILAVLAAIIGVAGVVSTSWNIAQTATAAVNRAEQSVSELRSKSVLAAARADQAVHDAERAGQTASEQNEELRRQLVERTAAFAQVEKEVARLGREIEGLSQSTSRTLALPSGVSPRKIGVSRRLRLNRRLRFNRRQR